MESVVISTQVVAISTEVGGKCSGNSTLVVAIGTQVGGKSELRWVEGVSIAIVSPPPPPLLLPPADFERGIC